MGAAQRIDPETIIWRPQEGPQTLLLTCPISDLMYGGSRGGGKTDGFLGKFVSRWHQYGRYVSGIFVRRTYDELDEVIARSQEIYPATGAHYAAGKRTWYFPDGARLKMRALQRDQDASKFQGHSYTDIYIDEAGNFPNPGPLDKLRATLRNPHGIASSYNLSANPGGPGHEWLKKRYVDAAPNGMTITRDEMTGEPRIYIPSRLEDNKILMETDPNYKMRIRQSGPAWLVQAWLKGDWNATPEGGIIKAEWFRRYGTPPADPIMIVQSWDTAYKPKQINDPSVCTTWAITRNGYYLLDEFRKHMTYPAVKHAVKNQAAKWKPNVILIEDKGSGQSLIQELKAKTRLSITPITPLADKVTRMVAVSQMFEAGLVTLPEVAAWLLDFEIELTTFPLAPHDDRVDSVSQFLAWAHQHAGRFDFATTGSSKEVAGAFRTDREIDESYGYGRIRKTDNMRGY